MKYVGTEIADIMEKAILKQKYNRVCAFMIIIMIFIIIVFFTLFTDGWYPVGERNACRYVSENEAKMFCEFVGAAYKTIWK